MSLLENMAPRGKGRPPKPRERELTPLEAAMLEPLPSQILELVAELNLAGEAVDKVRAMYRETKEAAEMTLERRRRSARYAVEAAERAVDTGRINRREINIDLNAARMRLEEAEALNFKSFKYPGVQQEDDARLVEARWKLAELLKEKERNDAGLAKDEERLVKAKQAESLLEKSPEAAAFDAWQRALAQREVAEQIGQSGSVPTVEEVEALQRAYEKAKVDAAAPVSHRLAVIEDEYVHAVQVVRDLQHKLRELLQPHVVRWQAAAEAQVSTAVKLISQAQQLNSLLSESGDEDSPFTFAHMSGEGTHSADPRIPGGDAMREVYLAIRASSYKVSQRL